MKSVLKTAILLFICSQAVMPVLSADTITIDINIQIQPIEMFIDGSDIPMMKKIAERQWTIQNEKYIRENYLQLSKNAILEKNYKKAIQYASIGLEYVAPLNNSFGEFYKLIGFAFLKNNDYVQAIKNYNIAINNYKLNDSSIYYKRGLARYYIYKLNDFEEIFEVDEFGRGYISYEKYKTYAYNHKKLFKLDKVKKKEVDLWLLRL